MLVDTLNSDFRGSSVHPLYKFQPRPEDPVLPDAAGAIYTVGEFRFFRIAIVDNRQYIAVEIKIEFIAVGRKLRPRGIELGVVTTGGLK